MKTITVAGQIDSHHRLLAEVPEGVAPGPVEVIVVIPESAEAVAAPEEAQDHSWEFGIAHEWHAELSDPREDIYSLTDGEPVNDSR